MGEAIVFTSGKGGVGKTTTIANIGAGLSRLDKKVIMLDTDMGPVSYTHLDVYKRQLSKIATDSKYKRIPFSMKNTTLK